MNEECKDEDWLAAIDDDETEKEVQAEDDEEKVDHGEDQEEEIIMPKHMRDPGEPTKKEREEHEVLHLPYRPW